MLQKSEIYQEKALHAICLYTSAAWAKLVSGFYCLKNFDNYFL